MGFQRILCLDFDGVFHWYRKGWKGPTEIYDDPVPGSFEWLQAISAELDENGEKVFDPQIYSSRSQHDGGIGAMQEWFIKHGLPEKLVWELNYPQEKPAAWLTLDDRCFQFRGAFPTAEYLLGFTSWVSTQGAPELMHSDADLLRQIANEGLRDATSRELLVQIANRLEGIR